MRARMRRLTVPPAFLCLVLITLCSSAADDLGKGYKERCSETEVCNPVKFLECSPRSSVCECSFSNETVYDVETNACVALVGHSCLRQLPTKRSVKNKSERKVNEVTLPPPIMSPEERDPAMYQMACVQNAKCSYPGDVCECEFRHYRAPNGTCVRQKGFGERCASNEQCDDYKFLSCAGGVCACDRRQRYDDKNDQCIVPVGANCKIINYRSIREEYYEEDECSENASCTPQEQSEAGFGVCECDQGFLSTMDGTCGKGFGESCSVNQKCSDVQFACRSGQCQCKYPLHQSFCEESGRCISMAGAPCDPRHPLAASINESYIGCTENALCVPATSGGITSTAPSSFFYCRCQDGFVETNEGKCAKAYGSKCERDDECDPVPELGCVNNVCNCTDQLQYYDEKHRSCLSLAGGRCAARNGSVPACVANAYCMKPSLHLEYGRCICSRGFSNMTPSRMCGKSTV